MIEAWIRDGVEALQSIAKELKRANDLKENSFPSSYKLCSAKEAADILGMSTVYIQKIAEEKFEGKLLSCGWVLNKKRVMEFKEAKDIISGSALSQMTR